MDFPHLGYADRLAYAPGDSVILHLGGRTDTCLAALGRYGMGGEENVLARFGLGGIKPQATPPDAVERGARWPPTAVFANVSTWTAYNEWGGASLYSDLPSGRLPHFVSRSRPNLAFSGPSPNWLDSLYGCRLFADPELEGPAGSARRPAAHGAPCRGRSLDDAGDPWPMIGTLTAFSPASTRLSVPHKAHASALIAHLFLGETGQPPDRDPPYFTRIILRVFTYLPAVKR